MVQSAQSLLQQRTPVPAVRSRYLEGNQRSIALTAQTTTSSEVVETFKKSLNSTILLAQLQTELKQ